MTEIKQDDIKSETVSKEDERNGVEKVVHSATQIVDTGVHYLMEGVSYPLKLLGYGLNWGDYGVQKGLNFVGDNVPFAKPVTDTLGSVSYTVKSLATGALGLTSGVLSKTVKYPVNLVGSIIDATATATRSPSRALGGLLKQTTFLTSDYAADLCFSTAVNGGLVLFDTQNLIRNTVKNTGKIASNTVSVFDKNLSDKISSDVEAIDGMAHFTNITSSGATAAIASVPGVVLNVPSFLEKVFSQNETEESAKAKDKISDETMVEDLKEFGKAYIDTFGAIRNKDASSLKKYLQKMSRSGEKIGRNISDMEPSLPVIEKESKEEKRKNVFTDTPRQIKNSGGR
ncbi:MAG: hypothetical protein E7013_02235 [Alphaproteobacteria bacterium]|nr:hypothetical protein [Alphaproteobacteria bacterium]